MEIIQSKGFIMTVSWPCIIYSPAVSAGRWAWTHELKHLYEVTNEVSCAPLTINVCNASSTSWNMDVNETSHFHRFGHGGTRCRSPIAALSMPSFLFKWYVLFTSPYQWGGGAFLKCFIYSWDHFLSSPAQGATFLVSAFHLKVLHVHTRGVSFRGGVLSESQRASLMVITLPDVGLLTMTPLAGPYQV